MYNVNKIRIGIISAGNNESVHASEFSELDEECQITAITDDWLYE